MLETKTENDDNEEGLWNMDFEGVVNKEGYGAYVWILESKLGRSKIYSYKLALEFTNNIAEYEALILALQLLKCLGAKMISVYGDSKLIIKHIKGEYSAKHPILRAYRNDVLDFLQCFLEYHMFFIPRD